MLGKCLLFLNSLLRLFYLEDFYIECLIMPDDVRRHGYFKFDFLMNLWFCAEDVDEKILMRYANIYL